MSEWQPPAELPDLRRAGVVALDTETCDDRLRAELGSGWPFGEGYVCGISVAYYADGAIRAHYFPIRHPDSQNFDPAQVFAWLKDLVASDVRIVTQNGLYDWGWLRTDGGILMPPSERLEEIGALATLIDENRYQYGLDALCRWRGLPGKDETLLTEEVKALGVRVSKKKNRPQAHIWRLPAHLVGPYAEADAANTLALFENLNPVLDHEGTRDTYRLEVDLLPMVHEMRRRGIRIDTAAAEQARDLLLERRDAVFVELADKLGANVGMEEIGRTSWLAATFDQHNIAYPRTEKGAPSFTAGSTGWMPKHPHWLPQLIVKADKYNNAAVNVLDGYILGHAVNRRIHAEIHPHRGESHGTKSFRFSYSDPPLQLMPSRDEEISPLIRGVFLPEQGEVWAKPDASQQEFRLVVHYADQHKVQKAAEAVARYRDDPDADFHAFAATLTGLERKDAKAVNFAKIYGVGVKTFAEMIGKPLQEAQQIYNQYDRALPFLRRLSEIYEARARNHSYIVLYGGARRHFNKWAPGGKWQKGAGPCEIEEAYARLKDPGHPWYQRPKLYRADTRNALNALIQGSAAQHTKLWMRAIWREGIVPLLQMHDCLDCSVSKPEQAETVARLCCEVINLVVPMRCDLKYGHTWGDAKHTWDDAMNSSATSTVPMSSIVSGVEIEADETSAILDLIDWQPPENPDFRVCKYCRLAIEIDADIDHTGDWLHPRCPNVFINRRLVEEGQPQIAWAGSTVTSAPPPSLPPQPEPRPIKPPPAAKPNGGGGGNGSLPPGGSGPGSESDNGLPDEPFSDSALTKQGYVLRHVYHYTLADGAVLYHQNRYELRPDLEPHKKRPPKRFLVHRSENGRKLFGAGPRQVIYNWPAIMRAGPGATVIVTEGEKNADALIKAGLLATTTLSHNWAPECVTALSGYHLIILEDHDEAGHANANKAKVKLMPVAASVRVVPYLHLWVHLDPATRGVDPTTGEDVSDWIAKGGNPASLIQICREIASEDDGGNEPLLRCGVPDIRPRKKWRIKQLMPASGVGLLSGQWGTNKTFQAIELAVTVIGHNQAFCGREVREPCGVLILATEGDFDLRDRIEAAVHERYPDLDLACAPIFWRESCPTLLAKGAEQQLIKCIQGVADECMATFKLPLGLVIIDVLTDAAGYSKAGEENDAAIIAKLFGILRHTAKTCDCFMLAVDHFGKTIEAGTKGSIGKEGAADLILVTLGERNVSGNVVNTRLGFRKVRGGPQGQEFPFQRRFVPVPNPQEDGNDMTCVIQWEGSAPVEVSDPWDSDRQSQTKLAMQALRRAMVKVLNTQGAQQAPEAGAAPVLMAKEDAVRDVFFDLTVADGTPEQKRKSKTKRWQRTLDRAETKGLIRRREIQDTAYMWFAETASEIAF